MIELLISISLMVVVVTGALSALITILRSDARVTAHMRMISEGQRMADFLRETTRLTKSSEIVLYPEIGPHTAVSYPVPAGVGEDGNEQLNPDGSLVWGDTLVVHSWPQDDPVEIRLTRFQPRETSLSPSQRFDQLVSVVENGNGGSAVNGSNSSTLTIAEVRGSLTFRTEGQNYNFHNSTELLDSRVNMGGIRLQPGDNTIRFQVAGKTSSSRGYGMMMDQLLISPAGIPIEAEALLPVMTQSGASATVENRLDLFWSDGRALSFPASSTDAFFEVNFHNDTWHETKFIGKGSEFDRTMTHTSIDEANTSTRLRPVGRDLAWSAMFQSGGTGGGASEEEDVVRGAAVRVVVRGGKALGGLQVLADGDGCTVEFEASDEPTHGLHILHAFISEAADHENPGTAINSATTKRLRFGEPDNPKEEVVIAPGDTARTVPVDFPIDTEKSYVISYLVSSLLKTIAGGGEVLPGNPWIWGDDSSLPDTHILSASTNPGEADLLALTWSDRALMESKPGIYGVTDITTTYVNEGVYTSRVVDTTLEAPEFKDIAWSQLTPPDTSIEFKIRTSDFPDMRNAPEWEDLDSMESPGNVFFTGKRYVQIRFVLMRDPVYDRIPELRNYTLRWTGEETNLDFGGVFHRYPSGGLMNVFVNDEPPSASFRAELNLTAEEVAFSNDKPAWSILVETSPRN